MIFAGRHEEWQGYDVATRHFTNDLGFPVLDGDDDIGAVEGYLLLIGRRVEEVRARPVGRKHLATRHFTNDLGFPVLDGDDDIGAVEGYLLLIGRRVEEVRARPVGRKHLA